MAHLFPTKSKNTDYYYVQLWHFQFEFKEILIWIVRFRRLISGSAWMTCMALIPIILHIASTGMILFLKYCSNGVCIKIWIDLCILFLVSMTCTPRIVPFSALSYFFFFEKKDKVTWNCQHFLTTSKYVMQFLVMIV